MPCEILTEGRSRLQGWPDQDRSGFLHCRCAISTTTDRERCCCRQRWKRQERSLGSTSPSKSNQTNSWCARGWNIYRLDGTRSHKAWSKGWTETSGLLLWYAGRDCHHQEGAQQKSSGSERRFLSAVLRPWILIHIEIVQIRLWMIPPTPR